MWIKGFRPRRHWVWFLLQVGTWVWINSYTYHLLGGWASIYQLFWCELQGDRVLTHPHIWVTPSWDAFWIPDLQKIRDSNELWTESNCDSWNVWIFEFELIQVFSSTELMCSVAWNELNLSTDLNRLGVQNGARNGTPKCQLNLAKIVEIQLTKQTHSLTPQKVGWKTGWWFQQQTGNSPASKGDRTSRNGQYSHYLAVWLFFLFSKFKFEASDSENTNDWLKEANQTSTGHSALWSQQK